VLRRPRWPCRNGSANNRAMSALRINLFAPNGRMGKAIAAAAAETDGFEIVADGGDVLVDFSAADALGASLDKAVAAGIPILVGTTGLGEDADKRIAEAAKSVAVLRAANTSVGVAVLSDLVERAAKALGPDWDIEIVEMHHRMKVDAPSGTALLLGEAAAKGRGVSLREHEIRARDGHTGSRADGAIGFASLRGGTVVGDHTVTLAGPYERIELTHRAEDRMIFARGALAAARWGQGKKPGLYAMSDVLGLSG